MNTSRHHLAEVIAEKTIHIKDEKMLAKEIAAYLLDEKQTNGFESLIRDILQYRADHGYVEVNVVSASPLNEIVISDVRNILKSEFSDAKSIVINQKHDDSVVGGIRIDMANEQLDMTVKSKLNTFKRLTALERK